MKQVQAMTTLVLIDGVTYQIALPKQYVLFRRSRH